MWARWLTLVLGLWLAVSPAILGYAGDVPAMQHDVILGLLVAMIALVAVYADEVRWIGAAVGIWLVLAPFVLAHASDGAATANEVITGLMVVASSILSHGRRAPGRLRGLPYG